MKRTKNDEFATAADLRLWIAVYAAAITAKHRSPSHAADRAVTELRKRTPHAPPHKKRRRVGYGP